MLVKTRSGKMEGVRFDVITDRLRRLVEAPPALSTVDPVRVTQDVARRIYDRISTSEIDELSANLCISLILEDPSYGALASRIVLDNHHRETLHGFRETVEGLYKNRDCHGAEAPLVSAELLRLSVSCEKAIEDAISHGRDRRLDYFAFKTLKRGYLLQTSDGKVTERPQHLFMRVALGIHGRDWSKVKSTYEALSSGLYTHATPTLFHAGTQRPQMSSCFLLGTEDSVEAIYKTISDCALIQKWAGGIGVHMSNTRAKGAYIRKTGGRTDGIVRMLQVYNASCRFVNQSGKRNGSIAVYLEPWHADVFDFLAAKRNHGQEEERARDLFYALWIPDLFMQRVEEDGAWYLMCPDECRGLTAVHGEAFETLYNGYVEEGRFRREIRARDLWSTIISSQIETGNPYMCYKDAVNRKSNQSNLGTLKSSNLCAEVNLFSDDTEYAVCNLASVCLPAVLQQRTRDDLLASLPGDVVVYTREGCDFCDLAKLDLRLADLPFREVKGEEAAAYVRSQGYETFPQIRAGSVHIGGREELWRLMRPTVDHGILFRAVTSLTVNLNAVIDRNFYPVPESKVSNMRHRPLGIGVQGLADVFMRMRVPFCSAHARRVNQEIFETISFAALTASHRLAKAHGPYESFVGSPLSKGLFQHDLWGDPVLSGRHDWEGLREKIVRDGVRNSVLTAVMPTASTSQIMGNNECCEPYTSNVYRRRTLAGEFTVMNRYLMRDLLALGIWDKGTRDVITFDRGSVQRVKGLPRPLKEVYRTVWEIPQKSLIEMAAERGPFICQSQSHNLWFSNAEPIKLTAAHLLGWKLGLKTGSYYVRSRPKANAQRFTMDPQTEKELLGSCEACSA